MNLRPIMTGIKTLFGKSGAKNVLKAAEETSSLARGTIVKTSLARGTVVKPSLPGVTRLERQFGESLFISETRTLENGAKQTQTAVYANNGAHIGQGGDNGLVAFRTKTSSVKKGESVFGGDRVEITKQHRDTMARGYSNEQIVKEYTPQGVPEHIETTLQTQRTLPPKVTTKDITKDLNGVSLHDATVAAKKAASDAAAKAAQAEQEAAALAARQAAEEAKRIAPRINVGKVFNKNLDEFKMVQEKTLADGTVVRKYASKGEKGANQYIVTKQHGNYREEYIVDTGKDVKIRYKQLGDAQPEITMQKGLNYRYTRSDKGPKMEYTDGKNYIKLGAKDHIEEFAIEGTNGTIKHGYNQLPDINAGVMSRPYQPVDSIAAKNLNNLHNEVRDEWMYISDLFKPYKA